MGLILALLLLPSVAFSDPPAFLGAWGSPGSGPGEFNHPVDVSVAPNGHVFVLDSNDLRVQEFTNAGVFVAQWPLQSVPGGSSPTALAVGPNGDAYVLIDYYDYVDYAGYGLIQRYSAAGALVGSSQVSSGWEATAFNCPDLAVTASADIIVADTFAHVRGNLRVPESDVTRFSSDLQWISAWRSTPGSAPGQFPTNFMGIAVDPLGDLFVTDPTGHHVNEFTLDGAFVSQWGSAGTGDGQFQNPWGIAIAANGNLIVTDVALSRVQEFTSAGQIVRTWGSAGSGPGQFNLAFSVAADANGDIYVADAGNDRIQKFGSGPTPASRVTWGAIKVRYR